MICLTVYGDGKVKKRKEHGENGEGAGNVSKGTTDPSINLKKTRILSRYFLSFFNTTNSLLHIIRN